MDAVYLLRKDLGPRPLLTRAEETELILQAQAGDQLARDVVFRACAPLMIQTATEVYNQFRSNLPLESLNDLIQEALTTLFMCISKFDPNKKSGLATFARLCSRQKCYTVACDMSGCVKVNMRARMKRLLPDDSPCLRVVMNLDEYINSVPNRDGMDEYDPGNFTEEDIQQMRKRVLDCANKKDAKLLKMRMKGQTLAQIGRHLGVSKERARQLIERAMDRARIKLGLLHT